MSARLRVRLTPRAGADRVDGVADGVLHVRVAVAPVDGAANEALCRLLSREIGVPRTSVRIATGATSRVKVVEVDGVGEGALRARWPGLA